MNAHFSSRNLGTILNSHSHWLLQGWHWTTSSVARAVWHPWQTTGTSLHSLRSAFWPRTMPRLYRPHRAWLNSSLLSGKICYYFVATSDPLFWWLYLRKEISNSIIIIIMITMTMFMVLSSWHSHCESSPGSFDECRLSAGWPPTLTPSRPTWAKSPPKLATTIRKHHHHQTPCSGLKLQR